ncbi:MAG: hypothetical protein GY797_31560 [Deltaproteobacteria bacterium]|nr:hypothetical protein [Deltaproteobacteria bacterium]
MAKPRFKDLQKYIGLRGYTKEFKQLFNKRTCPACRERYGFFTGKLSLLVNSDGTELSSFKLTVFVSYSGLKPPFSFWIKCPKCHQLFPAYAEDKEAEVLEIIETNRTQEPRGSEDRIIDNSDSKSASTRRLVFKEEWTQVVSFEKEKAVSAAQKVGVNVDKILMASASVGTELREKYSISTQKKKTYEEEISIPVPKNAKVKLTLHWKNIWQNGKIRMRTQENIEVLVPFRVLVGITFDQTQTDEE